MSFSIELIGYAAGFFVALAGLPQLIKIMKTKKTRDVSILLVLILMTSATLWLIYGYFIKSWPLIISDIVVLGLWIIILRYKLKYK